MEPRPKFIPVLCRSIADVCEERKFWKIVPWFFLLGWIVGYSVAHFIPIDFWSDRRWNVAAVIYVGFLSFSGLLFALSGNAFSKIYEILAKKDIADFLRRHEILDIHLFFIEKVQVILIFYTISSGVALITTSLALPIWVNRVIFACVIGFGSWAFSGVLSAIRVMNDLVWELAHIKVDDHGYLEAIETTHDARRKL